MYYVTKKSDSAAEKISLCSPCSDERFLQINGFVEFSNLAAKIKIQNLLGLVRTPPILCFWVVCGARFSKCIINSANFFLVYGIQNVNEIPCKQSLCSLFQYDFNQNYFIYPCYSFLSWGDARWCLCDGSTTRTAYSLGLASSRMNSMCYGPYFTKNLYAVPN